MKKQKVWTVKNILALYLEYLDQESERSKTAASKFPNENTVVSFLQLFVNLGIDTNKILWKLGGSDSVFITISENILAKFSEENLLEMFAYDYLYEIMADVKHWDDDEVMFDNKENIEWCIKDAGDKIIYQIEFDIGEGISNNL